MLESNSSYILKTGAREGSQSFQKLPPNTGVLGTDENGNLIAGKAELNYTSRADLVYMGSNVVATNYYLNPLQAPDNKPYRTPTSPPKYILDGTNVPADLVEIYQVDLEDPDTYARISDNVPFTIQYSGDFLVAPLTGGGQSKIYDEQAIRIDQKHVGGEVFYSDVAQTTLCNEPVTDVTGTQYISPEYNNTQDSNEITNEIYDALGTRVRRRRVTDFDTSKVLGMSVVFNILDNWEIGTTKEFYFRAIAKPIYLINSDVVFGNGSVPSGVTTTYKSAPGLVIFCAGGNPVEGFIYLHSYLDSHITNDESLQITNRSYSIKIEVLREGSKLKLVNAEYRIPYVFNNSDNTILTQGEFTFRTSTYDNYISSGGTYLSVVHASSGNIIDLGETAYDTIRLNIGTDWIPGVNPSGTCWGWENLFQSSAGSEAQIYMTVKTNKDITDATP